MHAGWMDGWNARDGGSKAGDYWVMVASCLG